MMKVSHLLSFCFLFLTLSVIVSQNTTATTFLAAASGDWDDPGTWEDNRSPQHILGTNDSVIISGNVTVMLRNDLFVSSGAVLIIQPEGSLRLSGGACLVNQGRITNRGTLLLESAVWNEGTLVNAGRVFNLGGTIHNRGVLVNAAGAVVVNVSGGRLVQSTDGVPGKNAVLMHGDAAVDPIPAQPLPTPAIAHGSMEAPGRGSEEHEAQGAERTQEIEDRARWEFEQLRDPKTGTIPRHIRQREYEFAESLPHREDLRVKGGRIATANTYTVLGPANLGGRSRAVAFDKLNSSILLAGGVSSGIFRTVNGGGSWTNVTASGQVHNVTAIAQDSRTGNENIWYYGTGEALGNSASAGTTAFYFGHGIFKSTDNGVTWSQLAATISTLESWDSEFDFVNRIVVDPTNGYVYAAVVGSIMRSTNGGSSWSRVLGPGPSTSNDMTDIVVTTGGVFYAALAGSLGSANYGVWTSTTGGSGSWTRIAGGGSPSGWNAAGSCGRIVLALAPSNENILYALYDDRSVSSCPPGPPPAPEAEFFKYDRSTTTWTDRSANLPDEPGCSEGNDPFAVQGGYNLVVAVKPDNPDFVVIGGTNAYRSTNGFATAGATTRIGGYASPTTYVLYANHHPDIHALAFSPASSSTLVCGDDGGIHQTSDVTAGTVSWTSLNNDYVTYQYYHVTLDPTVGTLNAIGGAQDNGTTATTGSSSFSDIWSGDGVAVGISDNNTYQYVGSQYGYINRRLSSANPGNGTSIKPSGSGSGMFVTYFHLNPDNTEQLWYASSSALYRTVSASTVTSTTWTNMTGVASAVSGNITALETSRGHYGTGHKLYIGTSSGQILRLNNPANAAAATAPTNITGSWSGYVSGIAVDPTDDKKVLLTLSNYGVTSIYYTSDASVASPTWTAVEGNLTLPSVRACVIVSRNGSPTEYYVGTSVGLFSTTTLNGGSTVWAREGASSIGYAVVRSLAYRPIDNRLLLGTHGNGMIYTDVPDPALLPREWRGSTSTAWATTTNWSHGAVPTSGDNVLVPSSGVLNEAEISSSVGVYNMTVETGRTVTVSGSGTLTVYGNIASSGTLTVDGTLSPSTATVVSGSGTLDGNGTVQVAKTGAASDDFGDQYTIGTKTLANLTVEFIGSAAQKSATSPFGNLKIDNASGVSLQAATTVNGVLTLANGLLGLGSFNLTLGGSATIGGSPSASAMIVPTGSGELRKTFTAAGSFMYPVGDNTGTAEYSPATLNFTSGTFSSAYAGIRLTNAKHPNNGSSTDYLTRYWTVTSSGITAFSCGTAFTYDDADITGTESNIYTGKWDGAWALLNPANTSLNQIGGTVSSFSDFTGGENSGLPVELVLFMASRDDASVRLRWKTATEQNNAGFVVERSRDGDRWEHRGFIAGHGTVNTPRDYAFRDPVSADMTGIPTLLYRLCQVDRDGRRTYSTIAAATMTENLRSMSLDAVFPHPLTGTTPLGTIRFRLPVAQPVSLRVFDMTGAMIARLVSSIALEAGTHTVPFDASHLPNGVYIIELRGNGASLRRTLTVSK